MRTRRSYTDLEDVEDTQTHAVNLVAGKALRMTPHDTPLIRVETDQFIPEFVKA